MAQLVELQKHEEEFSALNAELVFVFREEQEGVDGLKKIQEKHPSKFTLSLDLNKESSKAYSNERGTFDNFVVEKGGKIVEIIDGTLRQRATAEQLLKTLSKLENASE